MDPLMRMADLVVSGMTALSAALRHPVLPAEQDRTLELRVVDRTVVARDQNVVALTLAAVDREPLPPWYPGAHLDLYLPSGRLRQYSLCGDPADRSIYRIAVRRIPTGGGGSIEVHDDLPAGSVVRTSGPRNAFPLAVPGYGSPTQRLRFIAGGIGITPILPMLGLAERLGIDWSMVYAGRSRDSIPFLDEVSRFGDRIEIRTDDLVWIPTADDLLGECPDGTTVYACGPAPMLTLIRERLLGRDRVELHFERFAAHFVDMRAFNNGEGASAGRQRNRTGNGSAGSDSRVDYLLGGLIYDLMIISLQANPDSLLRICLSFFRFGLFSFCHGCCSFLAYC